jgi:hypothetical protein
MNDDTKHIFSLVREDGEFSELELFLNCDETEWKSRKFQTSSIKSILYGIQDVKIIEDKTEVSKIITGIHSIAGLFISKIDNATAKYYYMIMIPNSFKQFNLFLVLHSWDITTKLYQKLCMNEVVSNLSHSIQWKIPHDFICSIVLPNQETWFAAYGCCGILEVVGTNNIRNSKSMHWEFNNLVNGSNSKQTKTLRQINSNKRYEANKVFSKTFTSNSNSASLLLPEEIAKKFLTGRDITDGSFELDGNFGIKSKDLGGRTKIIPILSNLPGIENPTISQSEMHIVTELPDAFKIKHTFSTLSKAIGLLRLQCPDNQQDDIIGAVASKFLECIGWRMVEEDSVPHKFKELKIDIDQVLIIFELY